MTMHVVKFTGVQEVEIDIDPLLTAEEKEKLALEEVEAFGLTNLQILNVEEV